MSRPKDLEEYALLVKKARDESLARHGGVEGEQREYIKRIWQYIGEAMDYQAEEKDSVGLFVQSGESPTECFRLCQIATGVFADSLKVPAPEGYCDWADRYLSPRWTVQFSEGTSLIFIEISRGEVGGAKP